MKAYGKKIWVIPDTYTPDPADSKIPGHEAIIFTNTGDEDAKINMTLLFEDKPPVKDVILEVKAERSRHIRMDWLESIAGVTIPIEVPYSILVESNVKVVVQYSRMDTRLGGMALMTSLGYPVD